MSVIDLAKDEFEQHREKASKDLDSLLNTFHLEMRNVSLPPVHKKGVIDLVNSKILDFAGVYSLVRALVGGRSQEASQQAFFRAYAAYVAASGVGQSLPHTYAKTLSSYRCEIEWSKTNTHTLFHSARAMTSSITGMLPDSDPRTELSLACDRIGRAALQHIYTSSPEHLVAKAENTKVRGNLPGANFEVDGLEQAIRRVERGRESEPDKMPRVQGHPTHGLQPYNYARVERSDLVGMSDEIEYADTLIRCALCYHPREGKNFFNDFPHMVLYMGDRGVGKTYFLNHLATRAHELAKNAGKLDDVLIAEIRYRDEWQNGSYLNLLKQIEEMTSGERICIVFMDEAEQQIPNRMGRVLQDHESGASELFLKLRGGGFPNKSNYLLFAATNRPDQMEPPIIDAFTAYEVNGPQTAQERQHMLRVHLREGIQGGYVQIRDWDAIGDHLQQCEMRPREIYNIGKQARQRFRAMVRQFTPDQIGLNPREHEALAGRLLKGGANEYIVADTQVHTAIEEQVLKRSREGRNYLAREDTRPTRP